MRRKHLGGPEKLSQPKEPSGNDEMDEFAKLEGEMQAKGSAGSVDLMNTRLWHSNASNS